MSRCAFGCLFTAFISLSTTVLAQPPADLAPTASVPRVVRFDGVFTPADGQPIFATETAVLAVFDRADGGTPLWEETQFVGMDAQGHYAVLVGAGQAAGLPPAVLASAEPRWLEVRFARASSPVSRILLTSVPYALRAADADTLGGLPASAFLRSVGQDGTAGAAGKDAANGRADAPNISTGTVNYIGKFTNAVDLTSSSLYDTGSRIGLGNTAPLDFMHVTFSDNSGGLTGLAVQNLGSGAASYSGMLFYDQNGALGQFQGFNNSTHEYRINNIASGGTINFMVGSQSKFQVRNDGDINIASSIRQGGALFVHNRGSDNTAVGLNALPSGTQQGGSNVAVGANTLAALGAFGQLNVAVGARALSSVTANNENVAVGADTFRDYTGGASVAIGTNAGRRKISGSYNLYLGYGVGDEAANTESNTVRVGDNFLYTRFFVGGVRGITTGQSNAVAVVIDSNGQLGTINSSRRYKEDIQDMGEASSGLMRLRPVTYRYQQPYADGSMPIDYGLIAEEVEQVYPDLVAHLAGGEVETVQYHKINAMLLNEVQKQQRQNDAQQREIDTLTARLAALERLLATAPRER